MCRLLFILLLQAAALHACNVPVFRYALERWESDPFQLVVFHNKPLSADLQSALDKMEPVLDPGSARPNWKIQRVDTTKPMPPLWQGLLKQNATLPQAVLCTPEWTKGDAPLWSAELTQAALNEITDSPLRSQLRGELLKGTAVLWLIVDGKDKAKSDALHALIEKESKRLLDIILIPPNIGKDGVNVLSSLPIEVSFKTFRLAVENTAEDALRKMLSDGEEQSEPLLVPFFGRGRALAVMKESSITTQLIEETARFICGACSCQVKASNPGFDVLMTADWQSILEDTPPPPPEPKRTGKPEYVPIPGRKKEK
jgi:hypothetical protein